MDKDPGFPCIQPASSAKIKWSEHSSIGADGPNIDPAATHPKPAEPDPHSWKHSSSNRNPNEKMKKR